VPVSPLFSSRLAPAALLRDAEHGRLRFLSVHGDTLLLLITLGADQAELETGLAFASAHDSTPESERAPQSQGIAFFTQVQPSPSAEPFQTMRTLDHSTLEGRLRKDRHFVVPLRKRRDAGTLSADRITVGRAFNQDIVLRHGSVSKFHAWIEMDEARGAHVADAGSRNGTRVNDGVLAPRTLRAVFPGDVIRFGSVNAMICDPETFLQVVTSG
jgi:hypothetical protein